MESWAAKRIFTKAQSRIKKQNSHFHFKAKNYRVHQKITGRLSPAKKLQKQLAKPKFSETFQINIWCFLCLHWRCKTKLGIVLLVRCEKNLLQEGIFITMKAFSCIRCQHRCHWHSLAIAIFFTKAFSCGWQWWCWCWYSQLEAFSSPPSHPAKQNTASKTNFNFYQIS